MILLVICTVTTVLVLRKYARHGQEAGETTPSKSNTFGETEDLHTVSLHCHCQDQELDKVQEKEQKLIDI